MLQSNATAAVTDALEPEAELRVLRKADGGSVYLLGTCHVSESSAASAGRLVRRVRPSAVVLEICERRKGLLDSEAPSASSSRDDRAGADSAHSLGGVAARVGGVLSDWTELISLQYAGLEEVGVRRTGGEFAEAARAGREVGAALVLGDRDVELTKRRLQKLVSVRELLLSMLWDDSSWVERQAVRRHEAARELAASAAELDAAVAMGAATAEAREAREAALRSSGAAIHAHAVAAQRAAAPGFVDATLVGMLRRFWNYEVIGAAERARLRLALDSFNQVPSEDDMPMPPSMRAVLVEERDAVLVHALRTAAPHGGDVVGVVGAGHLGGICRAWGADGGADDDALAALRVEALSEPHTNLAPYAAAAAAALAVPAAAYRWRAARLAVGGVAAASAVGGAWFVIALRDRLAFFERTQ
jgi:pheromone shutdown protein TraB